MSKDKKIYYIYLFSGIAVVVLSVIGYFTLIFPDRNTGNDTDTNTSGEYKILDEEGGYTLTGRYVTKAKQWEIVVSGYLPNPCYKYSIDPMVLESYPEQVKVNLNITQPDSGKVCAQVIRELKETKTVSVSEVATFELIVTTK